MSPSLSTAVGLLLTDAINNNGSRCEGFTFPSVEQTEVRERRVGRALPALHPQDSMDLSVRRGNAGRYAHRNHGDIELGL